MTKQEIIDIHYELVTELDVDGKKGRVYKAVTMFDLPKGVIDEYARDSIRFQFESDEGWWNHNPDYGSWDAFTVEHKTKDGLDIYICSILVRPFSDAAQNVYCNPYTYTHTPLERLKMRFDSRVYDLIHNNKKQEQ